MLKVTLSNNDSAEAENFRALRIAATTMAHEARQHGAAKLTARVEVGSDEDGWTTLITGVRPQDVHAAENVLRRTHGREWL